MTSAAGPNRASQFWRSLAGPSQTIVGDESDPRQMRYAPAGSTFRPWIRGASSDTPSTSSSSCCSSSPRSPFSEGRPRARRSSSTASLHCGRFRSCSGTAGRAPRCSSSSARWRSSPGSPRRRRSRRRCSPPVILAFWVAGTIENRTRSALIGIAGAALGLSLLADNPGPLHVADVGFLAVFTGAPYVAGVALRSREERAADLEQRTADLEREHDEREREAIAEERARIARELHDVVGHSIGVMMAQTGAARFLVDEDPARARDALLVVEDAGRQALTEMRHMLEVLREDGDDRRSRSTAGSPRARAARGCRARFRARRRPRGRRDAVRVACRASSSPRTESSRRR